MTTERDAPIGAHTPRRRHGDTLSTVQNALRVLELVAAQENVAPKQVAAGLHLSLGTTYHLVNTLLDEGYLVRATDGSLLVGDRLPLLLERLDERLDPYPELAPELTRLAIETRSTAVLGRLVGRQVTIVAVQSFPGADHQRLLRSGLRGPAHTMALGKVLIAGLPRRDVNALLDDWSLIRLTDRTITRRDALIESLEAVCRWGFGLDLEEGVPGLTCVAAPIDAPLGRPQAAIAVGVSPTQFRFESERLIGLVVDAARRSSSLLGGGGLPDRSGPLLQRGGAAGRR